MAACIFVFYKKTSYKVIGMESWSKKGDVAGETPLVVLVEVRMTVDSHVFMSFMRLNMGLTVVCWFGQFWHLFCVLAL